MIQIDSVNEPLIWGPTDLTMEFPSTAVHFFLLTMFTDNVDHPTIADLADPFRHVNPIATSQGCNPKRSDRPFRHLKLGSDQPFPSSR